MLASRRWLRRLLAGFCLIAAIGLAGAGALGDSITVDEPSHLVAGYTALTLGDHRLSPDHPPLARLLLALPLLAQRVVWRSSDLPTAAAQRTDEAWRRGDFFDLGRDFLESWNDGQRLVRGSRAVAIGLLAALLVTIGLVARSRYGSAGGLAALAVAAFDPSLLAHGHLATIDVPFALVTLLVLVAAERWLAKPTAGRLAALAATFAAATLIKFSWFAVVPALVAMAIAARRQVGGRALTRTVLTGGAALAVAAWLAIWATYGFRYRAATGDDAGTATMHVLGDQGQPRPTTQAAAWETVFHDPATGVDRRGLTTPLLRLVHATRLLPEAYVYGAAYVAKKGLTRAGYLRGQHTMTGFVDYYPWAFAIKTPLPTLALVALGLGAAAWRWRRHGRLSPLAWGASTFTVVYLGALASSALNLGVRHLLPLTPLLAIAVGGAWPQHHGGDEAPPSQRARRLVAAMLVSLLGWLAVATYSASPNLLGYFNELVGGWRQGHLYLADSNLDWGQDLLRLQIRLRTEPHATAVWLAQSGDPPLPRALAELAPRWLFGEGSHAPHPAPIAGGLYVVSANELLGVYRPLARAEAWRDPRLTARFEQLADARQRRPAGGTPADADASAAPDAFEALRRLRLLARLAQRPPDERVGTSLFLFRLSDQQVAEATAP